MGRTLFGFHVPKCAGSTILTSVQEVLPPENIYQSTALAQNFRRNRLEIYEINDFGRVSFVFGHHVFDEYLRAFNAPYLFTFLRSPVDRALSNFQYLNRLRADQGLPLFDPDSFLGTVPSMCQFIVARFPKFIVDDSASVVDKTISILSHFDFVGDSRNVGSISQHVRDFLGIKDFRLKDANVSPQPKEGSEVEELKEKLLVHARDDIELYERFCSASDGDNPFGVREKQAWRRNEFEKQEFSFERVKEQYMSCLHGELKNHGLLERYLMQLEKKVKFQQDFSSFVQLNDR